jgi:hypothetical protein
MTAERERKLFRLAFAVLSLATLVPIWTTRFHPLPDLPNHIAAASVWHNYANPDFDFQRYYVLKLGPTPYWGYYLLAHLFAYPFGLDIANRLILSLYAVGLPIGILVLARRFGRSEWLSLFVFPLIWNFNLAIGFVPYCLGLALLPFALDVFDRFCETPTPKNAAWAIALGIATFFCHLLPWGMWLAMAGMLGLVHRGLSWKQLGARFAVWLVPVVVGVLVMRGGSGYSMGHMARIAWRRYPLLASLSEMPTFILDNYTTHDDDYPAIALALLFIVLKVTQSWRPIRLHDLRAESCFLVLIVAYFVLPRSILLPMYWWGVNVRFAAPAMIFGALCVTGEMAGWRRALFAGVAACGIALAAVNGYHWHKADQFFGAAQFSSLAKLPPPRSRVLVLTFAPLKEPEFRQNYAQSYPALFQAFHGGYYPANFDESFPLAYRQRFPSPGWRNAEDFRWDYHAHYYDYVLAYRQPSFGTGHAELIARQDPWTLWKMPGPRDDVPPAPPYPRDWATDPKWRPKH